MKDTIVIKGARENNLKNISLSIPNWTVRIGKIYSGYGHSSAGMSASVHGLHEDGGGYDWQA